MDLKIRLQGLGEEVSKEVYLDIMLSGLMKAPELKFIREMHYREEFTSFRRLSSGDGQPLQRGPAVAQRGGARGLGPGGRNGGVLIRPEPSM